MMGKYDSVNLLIGTLCLISMAVVSHSAANEFTVEGMIYCDTCRLQFMTRASYFIEGATVKLQCRNITTEKENYKAEATTNKAGQYSFKVSGDYEDDICQVTLLKSPKEDCAEIPTEQYALQAAQISLTSNNGEATPIRNANPLGFMKKEPLSECPEIIKELDMETTDEDEGHDSGESAGSGSAEAPESATKESSSKESATKEESSSKESESGSKEEKN